MNEIVKNPCESAAVKLTFVFATFGLLTVLLLAALLLGSAGLGTLSSRFFASFFAAVVGLYAAALVFGKIASRLICGAGNTNSRIRIIGIGTAWCSLLVSVLAGSSVQFFAGLGDSTDLSEAFFDYILKPLVWVMPFGTISALILGLLYAAKLKRISSR